MNIKSIKIYFSNLVEIRMQGLERAKYIMIIVLLKRSRILLLAWGGIIYYGKILNLGG